MFIKIKELVAPGASSTPMDTENLKCDIPQGNHTEASGYNASDRIFSDSGTCSVAVFFFFPLVHPGHSNCLGKMPPTGTR